MDVVNFISDNMWYSIAVTVFVFVIVVKFCVPYCRCTREKTSILADYDRDVEMKNVAPENPKDIPTDRESNGSRSVCEEEKDSIEEEPSPRPTLPSPQPVKDPHTVYVDMGMQTDPPTRRNNIIKVSLKR